MTVEETYLALIGTLTARSGERHVIQTRIAERLAGHDQPAHDDPVWVELDAAEAAERAAHEVVSGYQVRCVRPR